MISNKQTDSCLVVNISEKISQTEDAYACTASPNITGPNARSIFIIERADKSDGYPDNVIHFGQKLLLSTNTYLSSKKLYLKSTPESPLHHSKYSRFQEVAASGKSSYENNWEFEAVDPNNRFELSGEPVRANSAILIKHCSTCHFLAADLIEYKNTHGLEYEVTVHSYQTNNKSQNLALEFKG